MDARQAGSTEKDERDAANSTNQGRRFAKGQADSALIAERNGAERRRARALRAVLYFASSETIGQLTIAATAPSPAAEMAVAASFTSSKWSFGYGVTSQSGE